MDGFGFNHLSPDFGAEICVTPSSLWGNLQLPWECTADDCADLTDILSGHHCLQAAADTNKPEAIAEMSTPTTLDSVDSSTTTATAASAGSGWQQYHEHQKGAAPVAWAPQSEAALGDDHLPERQLFSLPLNQLGQLGDDLSTLLWNFGSPTTAEPGVSHSRKRSRSAESSGGEFEYTAISGGCRERDVRIMMGSSNQCRLFLPSSNQADGSSTTATTTNSNPNCSTGDVISIALSDVLRCTKTGRLNSPAPSSGAQSRDNLKIPLAEHRPPPSKRSLSLHLDQGASYTPFSMDFRRPTGRSGHGNDPEAIAKVKEMIYRAAVMRPVTLGREVSADKPRRRNVRISSDPQTVAARERRERISDRLRVLQRLVPGGSKMDTATMLDEACNYLKFLKAQLAAGPKATAPARRTAAGGKFCASAAGSSLSSRYPIAPLQSQSGFPAPFETLLGRKPESQFSNASFPSTRS